MLRAPEFTHRTALQSVRRQAVAGVALAPPGRRTVTVRAIALAAMRPTQLFERARMRISGLALARGRCHTVPVRHRTVKPVSQKICVPNIIFNESTQFAIQKDESCLIDI